MEQPPEESDGVQPQDLSAACALPRVFDLTRNGEECHLKANSIEALHVVQPPGWFISSGTDNRMVLSEDGVNPAALLPQQPSDQIQPDNAFSNTTVTLSYVSRSHVFPGTNPLSQHSQVYSVPISKAFSLHPAAYDAAQLVTDPAGAPLCVEMDQHCLQPVSVPVGLAACANSFELVSPAQVVENVAGLCYLPAAHDISAIQDVESLAFETFKSLQQNNPSDGKIPFNLDEMQNGGLNGLWDAQAFDGSFPGSHIAAGEGQHINGNPELLFLISGSDEPVLLQNSEGPASLAVSLNQNLVGALEDQVLAPVASIDEVKDVFFMPQPANSPYGDSSYVEETFNTKADDLSQGESDPPVQVEGVDLSTVGDKTGGFRTNISENLTGNDIDTRMPEQSEESCDLSEMKDEERETNKRTKSSKRMNGDISGKKKALVKKELPPRTRRGMKLEAIVQNIYPTRYKSSHAPSTRKSQSVDLVLEQPAVSPNDSDADVLEEVCAESKESEPKETTTPSQKEEEMTRDCSLSKPSKSKRKMSTSWSENVSKPVFAHSSTETLKKTKCSKNTKKPYKMLDKSSVRAGRQVEESRKDLASEICTKRQPPNKQSRGPVKTKNVGTVKRQRKKHTVGQASVFSSQEPEIKLKYANYKGEKKDKRDETFSPFVRVQLEAYSACTVINYPEEGVRLNQGRRRTSLAFAAGLVPAAPCLQYIRVSAEAAGQATAAAAPLVCCLCGTSANAMDLGDLYGPYYPDGVRPESRTRANAQELREEDSSDSDCFSGGYSKERAGPSQGGWHRKARHKACRRWTNDGELFHSSVSKRSRLDPATDWYSAPVVPLEAGEYWFHEDCAVWSAGVFLVRGKLYGLDKAVKMAKETICSSCHETGATLGCFFKGCPNKHHYVCAVQSGCVLNNENFSMKCRKHKNKSIKGVSHYEHNSR